MFLLLALVIGWTVPGVGAQSPVVYWPSSTGSFDRFVVGPEGRLVVTSSNRGTTRAWLDGELRHVFPGHHAAISPDGRWIVTGTAYFLSGEGDLRIFDGRTGREVQTRDSGAVRVLTISDDGALILAGGHRGEVKVYSLPAGELLHSWQTKPAWMTSVSSSPDGRFIAASSTSAGYLWERATSRRQTFEGHSNWVDRMLIGPEGAWVLTASFDGTARVWDAGTGKVRAVLEHGARINGMALNITGDVAVTGGGDGRVVQWRVPSGELIRRIALGENDVTSVALSPDGESVAVGRARPSAVLLRLDTGEVVRGFNGPAFSSLVAFSGDGERLAVGCCGGLRLYDPESTGQARESIVARRYQVKKLAFSSDGRRLLVSAYGHGTTVWELASDKPPMRVEGSNAQWVGGGPLFLAGGDCCGGRYDLWDAEGQLHRAELSHAMFVAAVAVAADGSVIATAAEDGEVRLWHGSSGEGLAVLSGPRSLTKSVAVASQGRYVAAGNAVGMVVVWRDRDPTPWKTLHHEEPRWVTHLGLSPETHLLVSATINARRLSVWDLDAGARRRKMEGLGAQVTTVDFLPDGERLLVAITTQAEAEILNLGRHRGRALKGHRDEVTAVTAGSSGRWLATASEDLSVRLWDATTAEEVQGYQGLNSWASAVALDPTGRFVAAGDQDGLVVVWNRQTGERIVDLFALPNDGWAVISPDGFWDAADEGRVQGLIAWQDDASDLLANLPDRRRANLLGQLIRRVEKEQE